MSAGAVRSARSARALVAALALVLPVLVLAPVRSAHADETTAANDSARTAWDRAEPGLAPAAVSGADFGQLYATPVDGQVYAQPLVVDGRVITATEGDQVYGLDSATGRVVWSRDLGPAWAASTIGCGDLVPDIGVTSTPVYDPASKAVYLTTKVDDGPDPQHPHWYLHALSPVDGTERPGWPVTIAGTPSNDGTHAFDPMTAMQRPGLLLLGGRVYAGFASHCDYGPYVGYVAGVDTTSRALSLWSTESGSSTSEAGIWQSGGGLVSDGPGRILLATGNGVSPAAGPGDAPPKQLAESVVRLQVAKNGTMTPVSFFSPSNAPTLDQNDTDLGSGGPMALPDAVGTPDHPHLLLEVGKDGREFLLDRDSLGGRSQGPGGSDLVVSQAGPYNGVWGSPAYFGGSSGSYVYTVENRGYLRASKVVVTGAGVPTLSSAGTSANTFGYTSGSPVVTSDGTDDSSALVWVVATDGPTGEGASLRAYDAVPSGGVLALRYSVPIGTASKFTRVATDGGRVFVGTRDGQLLAFGRPQSAPLTTQPVDLGAAGVGTTKTGSATVTATRTVTVSGATTTAPFGVGTVPRTTLQKGQTLSLPLTFTPTGPGVATATLQVSTDSGLVGLDLHGRGTRPGLYATPASLEFGSVVTGSQKSLTVELTNGGTGPLTVKGASVPGAPWTATGVPRAGRVVKARASVAVSVTYAPTTAGDASASLVVHTDKGDVTVALTGSAVTGAPHLTIAPASLAFGSVAVGDTASHSFTVTNDGNTVLTITKAAPPSAPFDVADPLSEGLQLVPGQTVTQTVDLTPTRTGPVSGSYLITSDDGAGAHKVTLTGKGTPAAPPFSLSDLQRNGTATLAGDTLVLTPLGAHQAGSAFATTPIATARLHARFTAELDGGSGGSGLTFALLAASGRPTALGASDGSLGFGGLTGTAVTLDTHRDAAGGDPSGNFVGISTGARTTGSTRSLAYTATAAAPDDLRAGSHVVDVTVTAAGHVVVQVDGAQVLDRAVAVPDRAYVGFTASTGVRDDRHVVSDVVLARAAPPPPAAFDPATAQLNGSAALSGSDLVLTQAAGSQTGSAFSPHLVTTAGVHARFTAQIGGGSGADGMAFAVLDRQVLPTTLGTGGGGLGIGGLPALVVALDTYQNDGDPSANFIGVSDGSLYAGSGNLAYVATADLGTSLRAGTHVIDVAVRPGGHVVVLVDGSQVIDTVMAVPTAGWVGFSGATGGEDDVHTVRDVTLDRKAP